VNGKLLATDGSLTSDFTRDTVKDALAAGTMLWLDLDGTGPETAAMLAQDFCFHPLAVEDAQQFGQRPKAEDYDGFTYIVAYGAPAPAAGASAGPAADGEPQEVHCFYAEKYMVTVHRGDVPAIGVACGAVQRRRADVHGAKLASIGALYHVLDALADSMFPYLEQVDERIDELQDSIFSRPTSRELESIFRLKRELVSVRRLVTPQRDTLASLLSGTVDLPGMTDMKEHYFRDVYDHLIRISDLVDSYRDLLSGSMDAYLSMTSNRLNAVMKQLTIIATVFLPLSFITGFFGQNFAWMVSRITSPGTFFGFGIGTEVLAVTLLFWMFWRRGWLGGDRLCQA
jgi:magnesium transporter